MDALFRPLQLPCGAVIKNRIVKSAMSDSLGDGRGNPTPTHIRLYERWAQGGLGASIIGEVQGDPNFAEKPGNLVLRDDADLTAFQELAKRGSTHDAQLWLQLGHAGAMAHPPISTPKGPSALKIEGLTCEALSLEEVRALPAQFARTAFLAKQNGFGGVQVHAAHGFLLSQFLSPLFNKRSDAYGGSIAGRMRLLMETIESVRAAVGGSFPIAIKLNATDQLEGGFEEQDALKVVQALDAAPIDLIDISGGTYFPGARPASDSSQPGAYFLGFAEKAKHLTTKPLMVTGGFKTPQQCMDALAKGVEVIGLARALVLDPALPNAWQKGPAKAPAFPRFTDPPEGGITAWYSIRLTEIGEDRELALSDQSDLDAAIANYDLRDLDRIAHWKTRFGQL